MLGHEGLAEIVEVGSEVTDFKPGELAAVSAVMPDKDGGTGHEGVPFTGTKLGRNINGMWADYFLVPDADRNLSHIPQGVSMEAALMCTDMFATGFTAAEGASIGSGKTVTVLGTGAVGLMAILSARLLHAQTIIAIGSERRTECTALAAEYGADLVLSYRDGRVLFARDTSFLETDGKKLSAYRAKRSPLANATNSEAVAGILDRTRNAGTDAVLVCGGGPKALVQACDLARYGTGIVSNVEYIEGAGEIGLPIFSLGRGMAGKTFRFLLSRGGRSFTERMLSYAAARKEDPGKLVTHHLQGFSSIPDALRMMKEKPDGLIKIMVEIK